MMQWVKINNSSALHAFQLNSLPRRIRMVVNC